MTVINSLSRKQTVFGAILSYGLIILNALYGIVLMPYIIGQIGKADYGVYKTISAFTSALMVLDLGTGNTAMRYIAKYLTEKKEDKISGFIKALLLQGAVLAGVVTIISIFVYLSINQIYKNGLSAAEISRAKQLFIILGITVVLHIFENILNGIITGYNRFIFANGCKFFRLIIRIAATYLLLIFIHNSLVLVTIDMCLVLLLILLEIYYIKSVLKIKLSNSKIEKKVLSDSLGYTAAIFTASVVSQIQSNLDNVIIGAIKSSIEVTIYSVALQLFNIYQQISSSISGVMLPTVINVLENDDAELSQTQRLLIKIGRIQFTLLGAAFAGFCVLGKEFISLLMHAKGYEDVYYLSIILMFPAIFELCTNVCLSILRAKKILKFYIIMLITSMIINAVISVIGTYFYNYYAAAWGTAISIIIGNIIMMNVFYRHRFGFNMIGIYCRIFSRIWVCIILSSFAAYIAKLPFSGLLSFLTGGVAFVMVYSLSLILFGLKSDEKKMLFKKIHKKNGDATC